MAATGSPDDASTMSERRSCPVCHAQTPHEVWVEVVEEGEGDNSQYSREPYRFAECSGCGRLTKTRMNKRAG